MILVGVDGNISETAAKAAGFNRDDFTSWNQVERVRGAFTFARACAIQADIPNAEEWRLVFDRLRVWPWRIIDSAEYEAEGFPLSTVVLTLQSSDSRAVRNELEAFGKAFRGMAEIRRRGVSRDLMSDRAVRALES